MAMEKLTEYEKRRLENIKRNDEMLAALNIHSRLSELSSISKRQRAQNKSYKMSPEKRQKSETPLVLRRSLRTRGVPPDASTAGGIKDDFNESTSKISPKSAAQLTLRKSPREPVPLSMTDAFSSEDDALNREFIETVAGLPGEPKFLFSPKASGDSIEQQKKEVLGHLKGETRVFCSVNLAALKLESQHVARVVPGRILNVRFFPVTNRRIVAVGNKFGNVGFWNIDTEEGRDGIYMYYAHSGPVSGIVIETSSVPKMLTSCYDGFIRLMDVERELFDLVYAGEYSIYALSQRPDDPKSLYFSEGHGEVKVWDLRAGKSSFSWNLHENRINTVDFNPENNNMMATSSTDGTVCIWDLRKISAQKRKCLKTFSHRRAVHSAYFSPSGRFLASTSLDDKVGLFGGANYEDVSMIYHYNQTGRWISSFRGIWGWDDSNIFIGNMKRGVDVISTAEKKLVATLQSEHVTAIPCRFDAHRNELGTLAAATSGGQVYIWTQS